MTRDKLTAQEVIKLVSNVIGEIEAGEDSTENAERYINLGIMITLTDWCIENIIKATWGDGWIELYKSKIHSEATQAPEKWYETLQKEVNLNAIY